MSTDINVRIGIVEDELIIAEKIKRILIGMEYLVCEPVSTYDEAITMIEKEKPDMLLLDINLNEMKDGIDLAEEINQKYHLPFIFLTANSDNNTIRRAIKVKPNAYLVKPFDKNELFAAIEIAINNYSEIKNSGAITTSQTVKDFIFIKEGSRFIKLQFDEIVYVESRENYVIIHTKDNKNSIIRSTFSDFLGQLPADEFFRTHRGFAVQLKLVGNIEPTEVMANSFIIPVSNTYRESLYKALGIKE
ncbi:MAG: response regulator [Bacteroidota bacterium]